MESPKQLINGGWLSWILTGSFASDVPRPFAIRSFSFSLLRVRRQDFDTRDSGSVYQIGCTSMNEYKYLYKEIRRKYF